MWGKATNKYHAVKTTVDGITFDSKAEANRYLELKLMERGGFITNLQRQVKYEVVPKTDKFRAVYYCADFQYHDVTSGEDVVEDVKGVETKDFTIKKKLMYYVHGIELYEPNKPKKKQKKRK